MSMIRPTLPDSVINTLGAVDIHRRHNYRVLIFPGVVRPVAIYDLDAPHPCRKLLGRLFPDLAPAQVLEASRQLHQRILRAKNNTTNSDKKYGVQNDWSGFSKPIEPI